jgi:hypothetical protein
MLMAAQKGAANILSRLPNSRICRPVGQGNTSAEQVKATRTVEGGKGEGEECHWGRDGSLLSEGMVYHSLAARSVQEMLGKANSKSVRRPKVSTVQMAGNAKRKLTILS